MTKSSCQLLTWKDPIKSGQVFGGIVFALISIKTINLINVIFRLGAVTLFVAAAAEYAGKLTTGVGFVTRFRPEYQKSDIPAKYASHVATVLEKLQLESQKILYAKDIEVTLKSAGICYFMYKLTALISLWSLAFLSVITAFTVPALYEKYQKEIDTAVADYSKLAKEKALDVQKQAYEKAGPMLEQAESKMGPVGAFIRSKVPVRTASSTVDSPVSSPAVEKTPLEFSSKLFFQTGRYHYRQTHCGGNCAFLRSGFGRCFQPSLCANFGAEGSGNWFERGSLFRCCSLGRGSPVRFFEMCEFL